MNTSNALPLSLVYSCANGSCLPASNALKQRSLTTCLWLVLTPCHTRVHVRNIAIEVPGTMLDIGVCPSPNHQEAPPLSQYPLYSEANNFHL